MAITANVTFKKKCSIYFTPTLIYSKLCNTLYIALKFLKQIQFSEHTIIERVKETIRAHLLNDILKVIIYE